MEGSFFDFIIYNAFEALLAHSDKRCLSINQLHLYRITMANKINDSSFLLDEESMEIINEYLKSNYQMSFDEEEDLLTNFMVNNRKLFKIKNDKIFVKDGISAEDLFELKFELESFVENDGSFIFYDISDHFDDIDNLKILGADKISNEIYKLLDLQTSIEEAYNNSGNIDNQNIINVGNLLTAHKLSKLLETTYYNINNYYGFLSNLLGEEEIEDLNLLNEEITENDDFYQNNNYIDAILESEFMHAIFGNNSLDIFKLDSYLDILEIYKRPKDDDLLEEEEDINELFDDLLEEEEYIDEFDDDFEEELDEEEIEDDIEILNNHIKLTNIFYLKYIETLDRYQNKYGVDDTLTKAKNRLIYLLDQLGYNLYKNEILHKAIDKVSNADIDYKNDLYDFYVVSRLFIFDILKTNKINDLTLKKVLLIITYYNYTKDKRIKNILNKYKETSIGLKLYDAIINDDINKMSSAYVKKLPKKEK